MTGQWPQSLLFGRKLHRDGRPGAAAACRSMRPWSSRPWVSVIASRFNSNPNRRASRRFCKLEYQTSNHRSKQWTNGSPKPLMQTWQTHAQWKSSTPFRQPMPEYSVDSPDSTLHRTLKPMPQKIHHLFFPHCPFARAHLLYYCRDGPVVSACLLNPAVS